MVRGKKHKEIADGRTGRNGQKMVCRSTADQENNGDGGSTSSGPSGEPSMNQAKGHGVKKVLTFNDQLDKAAAVLGMKAVESQWSYESFNNLVECLKVADPESKVFAALAMKAKKASILVSHGLGPFLKEKLVASLQRSIGFCLATDAATFKHQGLKKHVDLHVVFWDEGEGEIRSEFFDSNAVGHETASVQVEDIQNTLRKYDLSLKKILGLSHDNPTLMQATSRQLTEKAIQEGNPAVIDLVDYLHPTHTAFQKAVQALNADISEHLVNLHSFFKHSTARREDRNNVQLEMEQLSENLNQFFLRYVSTRWLTMGPVVQRALDLWESTVTYFLDFLTDPKATQANKAALKTDRYS